MASAPTTVRTNRKNEDAHFYRLSAEAVEQELKVEPEAGLSTEDAVGMIVNGFCKEVFRELPMEFAVEAQKLLGVSLEGSVG